MKKSKDKTKYNMLAQGLAVNIIGGEYAGRTGFVQAAAAAIADTPNASYLVAVTYQRGEHLASTIHSVSGGDVVPVYKDQWTSAQRWLKYAFGITASHLSSTASSKHLQTRDDVMTVLHPAFDADYRGHNEDRESYSVEVEKGFVYFLKNLAGSWDIEIVDAERAYA